MLGVIGVWLMIKRTLWAFPVGLVAVTVQGILFYRMRMNYRWSEYGGIWPGILRTQRGGSGLRLLGLIFAECRIREISVATGHRLLPLFRASWL